VNEQWKGLSPFPLQVKTYPFEYLSVNELLCLLDASHPDDLFLQAEDCKVLRLAGLDTVEDFTLISQQNLHMSTEITLNKILALYVTAERMIVSVHTNMHGKVDSIEEIRWEVQHVTRVTQTSRTLKYGACVNYLLTGSQY